MTERRPLPRSLVLFLCAPLGLAACAASAPAPAAPNAPSAPVMQATGAPVAPSAAKAADQERAQGDAESQLTALKQAEADLNVALSGRKELGKRPAPAGPGEASTSPKPGQPRAAPEDPCATACSALASMERATVHLCGLAGEGDHRCEDARARVRSATDRVRASCPACAATEPQP